MVNTINFSLPNINNSRTSVTGNVSEKATKTDLSTDGFPASTDTSTLSPLSVLLSKSAVRADASNNSSSRKELGEKATSLLNQISGDRYFAAKDIHDAEVPDSEDPQRLTRASDATRFINGNGSNPFAGMSREQLALISYDDSGNFTVNERRAAWMESSTQEQAWRQQAVAKAMNEYNSTGKLTSFFSDALDHYNELPALEQAQYPASYASKLQGWIDLDFNYLTHTAEGTGSAQSVMDKVINADPDFFS